ncbi:MAG: alpha/beta hydrolase [Gemmatimonadales bacterium]|nr:alpha/beta hydrolase [Gemmatimonadales bacterium]
MKTFLRRSALTVFGIFALSYGGMVAWLVANESAMVFQPAAYGGREQVPVADSLGLDLQAIEIGSTDGVRMATWIIRGDSTGPWLVLCHGNAGNITLARRQRYYADLARAGFNLVAFDYRGFGASSDVPPTEQGLYDDATAAYRYLGDTLGVKPDRIVIYGHSLGGGAATELAARVPAAGLILEGTFASVPAVGQERYPWLPIALLADNRFDNAAKLPGIGKPVLILHARADGTIPVSHGERLHGLAREPKELVLLGGDHDSAWEADRDRYMTAFTAFVRRVTAPAALGVIP